MNKEEQKNDLVHAGVAGASAETVQRFGSAVKEHIVSYSGQDNEAGVKLKKGLKGIAEEHVNPEYRYQNLRQQAGFSAEVKETANTNAERIIRGESIRKIRTDDLGRVNDPLYDHVEIDSAGNVIPNSASQMKFVGSSPQQALDKLASKKYAKYLENHAKIEVPSDYYDGILQEADTRIANLQKQVTDQLAKGNTERAEQLSKKIENYQAIKENLRKSTVSNDEAMFARLHPKLSTVKSVAEISHRAGVETAGYGAVIGGSVAIVENMVALVKGEEEPEQAILNVAKGTASSAVVGYGTGFAGSAIKGVMQNATAQPVRVLSNTNLPGVIVAASVSASKTMKQYLAGEIDGVECFEQLGEQTIGMMSSALFAAIGQIAIPIPVVGGLIGSMLGYAIASASYGMLLSSMKEAKLAHEERMRVEKECARQIALIRQYRKETEAVIATYLTSNIALFHNAFEDVKDALRIGDVDGSITAANTISEALGKKAPFRNFKEFDDLMSGTMAISI